MSKCSLIELFTYEVNKDLQKYLNGHINKKSFDPELKKQFEVVISFLKILKLPHLQICFNVPVSRVNFQKHLGIYLDEKMNFKLLY